MKHKPFPPEVVQVVREAIRKAKADCEEYNRQTRVSRETLERKINVFQNSKRIG